MDYSHLQKLEALPRPMDARIRIGQLVGARRTLTVCVGERADAEVAAEEALRHGVLEVVLEFLA